MRCADYHRVMRARSPEWLFLFAGVAFDGVLWGWYLAALVWWIEDLGFGPLQLMLLGTLLLVVQQVSEVPTGVVADRYSRKWSVVIGFVIFGIAVVLSVASTQFWVILVAQGLAGFGWTFRSGADIAWISAEAPQADISKLLVRRHRLHLYAGGLAILGVMAAGAWSLRGVMALIGCWIVLVGAYLAVSMPDHRERPGDEGDELSISDIFRHGFGTAESHIVEKKRIGMMPGVATGIVGWRFQRSVLVISLPIF